MKIFTTSNIHFGLYKKADEKTKKMAKTTISLSKKDDLLIFAGNLGVIDDDIEELLNVFLSFRGKKLIILGNHDLWVCPPDERNSRQRENDLKKLFELYGYQYLENNPYIENDFAVIGTIGWYDYSFAKTYKHSFKKDDFEKKAFPLRSDIKNNDGKFLNWGNSDFDKTEMVIDSLKGQLQKTADKPTVCVTHFLATSRLLKPITFLTNKEKKYFRAFLGSEKFGELFTACKQEVPLVICGHSEKFKHFKSAGTNFFCVGSTYYEKTLIIFENNMFSKKIVF